MKKKILFYSVFVILVFSCQKTKEAPPIPDNSYGLPNATQAGANVFSCRANNENWIAPNDIYRLNGMAKNDTLAASGSYGTADYFDRLLIRIDGKAIQNKKYSMPNDPQLTIGLLTNQYCYGISNAIWSNATSGYVDVTRIDQTKKIISGNFTCKIPIPGCDTIAISSGRFDINYN